MFVWMILSVDNFSDLCHRVSTVVFSIRVVSSPIPVIFQDFTIVVVIELTGCVKAHFHVGSTNILPSPGTSIAFHPVAESNRAWVNGNGIV